MQLRQRGEFAGSRDIVLNGRIVNGRTHQNENGTYASLDLRDARTGDTLSLKTEQGTHTLMKEVSKEERPSPMENWKYVQRVRRLGAVVPELIETRVALALHHPNPQGSSSPLPSIVIRPNLEVNVHHVESENPYQLHSLGTVEAINLEIAPDSTTE